MTQIDYNEIDKLNEAQLKILWESVCGTFIHVYENDEKFYKKMQEYKPVNGVTIDYFMDFFITSHPLLALKEVKSWDKEIDFNKVFVTKEDNEINEMDKKIASGVEGFIYEYLDLPSY